MLSGKDIPNTNKVPNSDNICDYVTDVNVNSRSFPMISIILQNSSS